MYRTVIVLCPLVLTILLSKISVPQFSNLGLGVALPLVFVVTAAGLATGVFRLHTGRLVGYLILAGWVCTVQIFGKPFSVSSLCFFLAIFFPYILQLRKTERPPTAADESQAAVAAIGYCAAIIGCLQYFAQYLFGPRIAFPIEHFVPSGFIIQNYNYLNALYYGSAIYKSNGVFFLEPSFYSQFIAISLLVELTNSNRPHRVLVHLAALACTFSGTGLIMLSVGLLTLIVSKKRLDIVFGLLLLGGVALVIGEALNLTIFLQRTEEFSNTRSSGFQRFVSWSYLLDDQFWSLPNKIWTGYGVGTFGQQQQVARYDVFESSFAKTILEFGLPGAALFFGFLFYCVFTGELPPPVKAALLVCLFMNGAYSESIAGVYLSLLLWPSGALRLQEAQAAKSPLLAAPREILPPGASALAVPPHRA